jgi:lysophospholipid acyltransferase (LPLAT)-like uncharacterized protein
MLSFAAAACNGSTVPEEALKRRVLASVAPPLGALVLRSLGLSWNIGEAGERSLSPLAKPTQPKIYAVWHEAVLAAVHYRDQPVHALASQSFDGELISRTLERLGYGRTARGSSSRGGATGALELERFLEGGEHALITVDGPKGPRHQAKDGAIKLSRVSGCAVVPVAFACSPSLRLRSWDRMLVPLPFSRGVFWFGKELRFSGEGEESDEDRKTLQEGLDAACAQAASFIGSTAEAAS